MCFVALEDSLTALPRGAFTLSPGLMLIQNVASLTRQTMRLAFLRQTFEMSLEVSCKLCGKMTDTPCWQAAPHASRSQLMVAEKASDQAGKNGGWWLNSGD